MKSALSSMHYLNFVVTKQCYEKVRLLILFYFIIHLQALTSYCFQSNKFSRVLYLNQHFMMFNENVQIQISSLNYQIINNNNNNNNKKHLRIVRGFTTSLIKPQFSNFFLAKPLFWVAKKLANTSTIFSKATLYSNSTTLFNIVALPK